MHPIIKTGLKTIKFITIFMVVCTLCLLAFKTFVSKPSTSSSSLTTLNTEPDIEITKTDEVLTASAEKMFLEVLESQTLDGLKFMNVYSKAISDDNVTGDEYIEITKVYEVFSATKDIPIDESDIDIKEVLRDAELYDYTDNDLPAPIKNSNDADKI